MTVGGGGGPGGRASGLTLPPLSWRKTGRGTGLAPVIGLAVRPTSWRSTVPASGLFGAERGLPDGFDGAFANSREAGLRVVGFPVFRERSDAFMSVDPIQTRGGLCR